VCLMLRLLLVLACAQGSAPSGDGSEEPTAVLQGSVSASAGRSLDLDPS
jgi:hypothetical protein